MTCLWTSCWVSSSCVRLAQISAEKLSLFWQIFSVSKLALITCNWIVLVYEIFPWLLLTQPHSVHRTMNRRTLEAPLWAGICVSCRMSPFSLSLMVHYCCHPQSPSAPSYSCLHLHIWSKCVKNPDWPGFCPYCWGTQHKKAPSSGRGPIDVKL